MPKNIGDLKNAVAALPLQSGVYRFLDKSGTVIYVGKAKSLKKRVAQYFQSQRNKDGKTLVMVGKIAAIEHTVVDSEADAFLLENNLIKELRPKYNILLKDGKTYPWICIKNEPFSRVFSTRQRIKDGSKYFGPYTSGTLMYIFLDLITQLFRLRNCNLSLSNESITLSKNKVCLQYHLKKCKGPCIGAQSREEYQEQIDAVEDILSGKSRKVKRWIEEKMQKASDELRFEDAQNYKKQLILLEQYQSKSVIVSPSITNVDVFSIEQDDFESFVNYLRVVEGMVVQSYNMELKMGIMETKEDQLLFGIEQVRNHLGPLAPEIIVPFVPEQVISGCRFHVPQRGDKLHLLEMSTRNAKAFKMEKIKRIEQTDPDKSLNRLMQTIQKDLKLSVYPLYIECFDNSNIQGSNPVAVCVAYKKGKQSKRDYRKYHIKTVTGPDDYSSMEEVLRRRYSRLLSEEAPLPQLIVVDGGKGQLGIGVKVLEGLGLAQKIAIVALAERLENLYLPGDPDPLFLDKNGLTLRLLMQMRDEAHRFGIGFHRDLRSKRQIDSRLRQIPGIGPEREAKLLRRFKSVKAIFAASVEELAKVVGASAAQQIKQETSVHNP
ncbi:MAG: excinuclease ABC subunit UvrC [Prevotellaceae bacterium]|jgi:excinuclease ABC subunit C|nr:excinuclease ABC subunit UvrC [Prevotellaceae bacterium]